MEIDPVLTLAHELHMAEQALRLAKKLRQMDVVSEKIREICDLHDRMRLTEPASALGAAKQLSIIADVLPQSQVVYASHFREIAARLECGTRDFHDVVWLRAFAAAIRCPDETLDEIRSLIKLALKGVTRPVVICRTMTHIEAEY